MKNIKWYLGSVVTLWLALVLNVYACISDKLQADINEISPFIVKVFSDANLTEVVKLNRQVLQNSAVQLKIPATVKVPRNHTNVWAIINNGGTNKDLMANGYAPIGPDGNYIELHHIFGQEPGPMAELSASMHRKESKTLHVMIEKSFRREPQKVRDWDKWREEYWKLRSKDF